ncbi:hypothetical protein [Paludisphaera soli]|uniref:hypothetical protein n=1 Tax=Paludisphaera soli TaxID=2712865 RepID=UPI0013EC86AD|nr:hypothetical protein [Paludisphaera soli]
MPPEFYSVMFYAGLYCWLRGTRRIGKPPGLDATCDAWHERFGKTFRLSGRFLMLVGVAPFFKDLVLLGL